MDFDSGRAAVVAGGPPDAVVGRWPGLVCVAQSSDPTALVRLLDLCAEVTGHTDTPGRVLARRLAGWLGADGAPGEELRFGTLAVAGGQWAAFLSGSVELVVPDQDLVLSGSQAAAWADRLLAEPDGPVALALEGVAVPPDMAGVHDLRLGVVPGSGVVLVPGGAAVGGPAGPAGTRTTWAGPQEPALARAPGREEPLFDADARRAPLPPPVAPGAPVDEPWPFGGPGIDRPLDGDGAAEAPDAPVDAPRWDRAAPVGEPPEPAGYPPDNRDEPDLPHEPAAEEHPADEPTDGPADRAAPDEPVVERGRDGAPDPDAFGTERFVGADRPEPAAVGVLDERAAAEPPDASRHGEPDPPGHHEHHGHAAPGTGPHDDEGDDEEDDEEPPALSAPPEPAPPEPTPVGALPGEATAMAGAVTPRVPSGFAPAPRRAERILGVAPDDPPRPPLEAGAPGGVAQAGPPGAESGTAVLEQPQAQGHLCARGHLNDPRSHFCVLCGIRMNERTGVLVTGNRPPLGLLVFDDGCTYTVDAEYLVGRMPEADQRVRSGVLRAIIIEDRSGSVSRVHAEVRLQGWDVMLVDSGSRNGTYLSAPGEQGWTPLPPHQSRRLLPGTKVRLGARTFTFESPSGVR